MVLSVVIVSYNVKYFLEQCLSSLKKAIESSPIACSDSPSYTQNSPSYTQTEVFIVDNDSSDGTLDFLAPLYPDFHFIQNKENTGFAKANNHALAACKGEFILFLNPDTILAEDSLEVCLSFLKTTPDAGALGVKMIDGSGRYLKESKRGFPSPATSFFKMSGLASLFPRSKRLAAYYMGHLPDNTVAPVDSLSGAYMMIRKTVLDKTGGFDERFFMYAEDIDLSMRILQTGHRNYYLPDTTIIHFKGESTRKDLRYLKIFYDAMDLFMAKHFGDRSSAQRFVLRAGMRFHQSLSAIRLPFKKPAGKSSAAIFIKGSYPPVFIRGSETDKTRWKKYLNDYSIAVTENEKEAKEIFYCEGAGRSWKSIIEEIEKNKGDIFYKFHGTGTHAAVGSSKSANQGETLIYKGIV